MHNKQSYLRKIIREMLLQEEVYGKMAKVYHGSKTSPDIMIPAFIDDTFRPGAGSGAIFGRGLYTVYDLSKSQTDKGEYGKYIYKLGVNLDGFISFDPDATNLIYGQNLTPADQAREAGYDVAIVEALDDLPLQKGKFTVDIALQASRSLRGQVKGIVFTDKKYGRVVLVYDVSTVVPLSWKLAKSDVWNKIDRDSLKPSIERFTSRVWSPERYEKADIKKLRDAAKMPIGERVVDGDLNLKDFPITTLPTDLHVRGSVDLRGVQVTSLPPGLRIDSSLFLNNVNITELPSDLVVGGSLHLENTPILTLPVNLQVNGDINLHESQIMSLPDDFSVNGSLILSNTQLTSLPAGLRVSRDLSLRGTQITKLPADIEVGGSVHGFKGDPSSVPERITLFTLY